MSEFPYTWIYVVRNIANGRVKIGHSRDPRKRVAQLQTSTPDKLYLMAAYPGVIEDERALHENLEEGRVSGEWFDGEHYLVQRFVNDVSCSLAVMDSWCEYVPAPKSKGSSVLTRFGSNVEAAETLAWMAQAPKRQYLTALEEELKSYDIEPDGEVARYGIRVAIGKGVSRISFVSACAVRGVEWGNVEEAV